MTGIRDALLILAIAEVAHEANRTYCKVIGDESQSSWSYAENWQQESAINGVKFHIDNPNATPEDSHKNWMREKFKTGWEYGEEKDIENKFHPCLMPYEDLPVEQKIKDSIFIGVVRAFLKHDLD